MFSRFLGSEVAILESPLPPNECIRRLQGSVRSRFAIFGPGAIVGRVDEQTFRIRNASRRGFQLTLHGELEAAGRGTRLVCRLGRSPWHFLPIIVFAVIFLSIIAASVARVADDQSLDGALPFISMLFFFGVMCFMGVLEFIRSKDDRDILLDFLQRVAESRVSAGQEPAVSKRG